MKEQVLRALDRAICYLQAERRLLRPRSCRGCKHDKPLYSRGDHEWQGYVCILDPMLPVGNGELPACEKYKRPKTCLTCLFYSEIEAKHGRCGVRKFTVGENGWCSRFEDS